MLNDHNFLWLSLGVSIILEPPWFLLYINDSPEDLFSTPNLFADEA